MPIPDGLALYSYNLASPPARVDIGRFVEQLHFTTTGQGGFGILSCRFAQKDARLLGPQFRIFSNIALMNGPFACFLGRWDEPASVLDPAMGDYIEFSAQGAATCLADDPLDTSYGTPALGKTAQQILIDQFTTGSPSRSNYLLIDPDTSQVLPTNPAATFIKSYPGKSFADVLNDLLPTLGDYVWQVWDHRSKRDAASLPTWQLYVHARDTSTVAYSAYLEDVESLEIRPAVEYSYNVVTLAYKDSTTQLPASVTVADSRLTANYGQGTAPFPMRRLRQDKSTLLLSSAEASTIANALLSQYQNGGFKMQVVLVRARNNAGVPIPLFQVRADSNIYLPNAALQASTLPLAVTANSNLFYIQETTYDELAGQSGAPALTLTCDTFTDQAAFQIARLEYQQTLATQNQKTTTPIQQAGIPIIGVASGTAPSNATTGMIFEFPIDFPATCTNTPTSITFTATTSTNCTVAAQNITQNGFSFQITTSGNGAATWRGSYRTNGN